MDLLVGLSPVDLAVLVLDVTVERLDCRGDQLATTSPFRSIASWEGMVLVGDDPATALLPQPNGQAEAIVGVVP